VIEARLPREKSISVQEAGAMPASFPVLKAPRSSLFYFLAQDKTARMKQLKKPYHDCRTPQIMLNYMQTFLGGQR